MKYLTVSLNLKVTCISIVLSGISIRSSVLFKAACGLGPTPISKGPLGGFCTDGVETEFNEISVIAAKISVSPAYNFVEFNFASPPFST